MSAIGKSRCALGARRNGHLQRIQSWRRPVLIRNETLDANLADKALVGLPVDLDVDLEMPAPIVARLGVAPDVRDAKEAKIGGSLHRLRHTFGANLTMAGVPLRRVQDLMGHAD